MANGRQRHVSKYMCFKVIGKNPIDRSETARHPISVIGHTGLAALPVAIYFRDLAR